MSFYLNTPKGNISLKNLTQHVLTRLKLLFKVSLMTDKAPENCPLIQKAKRGPSEAPLLSQVSEPLVGYLRFFFFIVATGCPPEQRPKKKVIC